jgi:hypothetical protein
MVLLRDPNAIVVDPKNRTPVAFTGSVPGLSSFHIPVRYVEGASSSTGPSLSPGPGHDDVTT